MASVLPKSKRPNCLLKEYTSKASLAKVKKILSDSVMSLLHFKTSLSCKVRTKGTGLVLNMVPLPSTTNVLLTITKIAHILKNSQSFVEPKKLGFFLWLKSYPRVIGVDSLSSRYLFPDSKIPNEMINQVKLLWEAQVLFAKHVTHLKDRNSKS